MTFVFNTEKHQWEMRERGGRIIFIVTSLSNDDLRFWTEWAAKQRAEGR